MWFRAVIQGEIRQPARKVSPTELHPESRGTASAGASRNEVELFCWFFGSVIVRGGDSRQIISLDPV